MRPAAAEQQENRATFGMEIHNRTQVIEKPKKLSYDDDFYRSEFNYTNTFIDANNTTHHSGHHIINSTTNVVNSTAMIDRRQTSVISTPKLNFYRSIDSLNVASIAEDASMRFELISLYFEIINQIGSIIFMYPWIDLEESILNMLLFSS